MDPAARYSPHPTPQKNYHLWIGANRICCRGRCQMGPHPTRAFLTLLLILGPQPLFLASFLDLSLPLAITQSLTASASVILLFFTVCTDPGYLPHFHVISLPNPSRPRARSPSATNRPSTWSSEEEKLSSNIARSAASSGLRGPLTARCAITAWSTSTTTVLGLARVLGVETTDTFSCS